ncbi:YidC/Oxa1 family membrane protein insertase [Desulfitispora alkaliphila]|uniref:YidC/Oxa1 family membrane protein insertase n=1 Tax=Desulfitispora alkaliphila TaxID=622674 RepID=UPI003D1DCC99
MFQAIIDFISNVLQFLFEITETIGIPSYGLAIIMLTILIKLVLFPLTRKQMKSMKAMQRLQPEIKKLQDKYKNKPEKAQQEILALYKEEKVNPLAGCLPLIVQLPILFALFRALDTFEFGADPGFLWVPNLSNPDPIILPLLVASTMFMQMFIQQKLTGANAAPEQAQMQKMFLYVMPIMLGFFARNFPAGLALYWMMFSIVGTIEQLIIHRPALGSKEGAK